MSLRDEVESVPYKKREYVHRELEKQGESPEEFEELIADPTVQPASIHRMLQRRDIEIGDSAIWTWCKKARRVSA